MHRLNEVTHTIISTLVGGSFSSCYSQLSTMDLLGQLTNHLAPTTIAAAPVVANGGYRHRTGIGGDGGDKTEESPLFDHFDLIQELLLMPCYKRKATKGAVSHPTTLHVVHPRIIYERLLLRQNIMTALCRPCRDLISSPNHPISTHTTEPTPTIDSTDSSDNKYDPNSLYAYERSKVASSFSLSELAFFRYGLFNQSSGETAFDTEMKERPQNLLSTSNHYTRTLEGGDVLVTTEDTITKREYFLPMFISYLIQAKAALVMTRMIHAHVNQSTRHNYDQLQHTCSHTYNRYTHSLQLVINLLGRYYPLKIDEHRRHQNDHKPDSPVQLPASRLKARSSQESYRYAMSFKEEHVRSQLSQYTYFGASSFQYSLPKDNAEVGAAAVDYEHNDDGRGDDGGGGGVEVEGDAVNDGDEANADAVQDTSLVFTVDNFYNQKHMVIGQRRSIYTDEIEAAVQVMTIIFLEVSCSPFSL